jgi:hypothetical protein
LNNKTKEQALTAAWPKMSKRRNSAANGESQVATGASDLRGLVRLEESSTGKSTPRRKTEADWPSLKWKPGSGRMNRRLPKTRPNGKRRKTKQERQRKVRSAIRPLLRYEEINTETKQSLAKI